MELRYVELFAGVGGFRLGIERAFYADGSEERGVQVHKKTLATAGAGLQPSQGQDTGASDRRAGERPADRSDARPLCVFANEWDKYAAQTYNKNFGGSIDTRDITTIGTDQIPDHDLLVGGFPCQAFSVAGKRKGFNETRGTLFFEIARILADKKPPHFLLENVKGLLSHDSGRTFQTILGVLADLGYRVEWQVLNSKDFGVPQNRERVFIIGHFGACCGRQVFPITRGSEQNYEPGRLHPSDQGWLPQGEGGREAKQRTGDSHDRTPRGDTRNKRGTSATTVKERQDSPDQPTSSDPDNTIGRPSHSTRIRRLTPIECERLQGFPDNWTDGVSDTQRYKQMGNAVTVNVIEAIISELRGKK